MQFVINEGRNKNLFLQDERVNVHVLWRNSSPRRLQFCFPEGNSGVGVDLVGDSELQGELGSWTGTEGQRGAEVTLVVNGDLIVGEVCADTLRSLRDWKYPEAHGHRRAVRLEAGWVEPIWTRVSATTLELRTFGLSGRWIYTLALEVTPEVAWIPAAVGGVLRGSSTPWTVRVRAGHRHPALTPLGVSRLLSSAAETSSAELPPGPANDAIRTAVRNLSFLAYEEKLLAGSWQFLTYFGRDTLITSLLLGPSASMAFHEAALRSVVERLSLAGQVAHEEDIAEQAAYRGGTGEDVCDYKMVDDDFLLLPALAAAAKHPEGGALWWQAFSTRWKEKIDANIRWCLSRLGHLVGLDHEVVGDWRDSHWGLGGGHFPNSVNVGLVPVFRKALEWYSGPAAEGVAVPHFWTQVPGRFSVWLSPEELRGRLAAYLGALPPDSELGRWLRGRPLSAGATVSQWLSGSAAVPALDRGLTFSALSLDREGRAVEVMNSDCSFRLFLDDPSVWELEDIVTVLELPYPLGLAHPVGFLTANPVLSDRPDLWEKLGNHAYHGAVVWSWQDAMIALGLSRQARRADLDPGLKARIEALRAQARDQRRRAGPLVSSELWSWTLRDGEPVPIAFGAEAGDETESNAIQLWSSANLALARE